MMIVAVIFVVWSAFFYESDWNKSSERNSRCCSCSHHYYRHGSLICRFGGSRKDNCRDYKRYKMK
ncbi:MAG: hypothetical protein ACRC92_02350 [Peptostreptococcaceae bacterium]